MSRILMLMAADSWQQAAEALQDARAHAAHAERLSYGLSLRRAPGDAEQAAMHALGTVVFLAPGRGVWKDMSALWQGETYVLLAQPDMRFTKGWDRALIRSLGWCHHQSEEGCVLTGCLPRTVDPVDAVYPVAAERIDRRERLHLRRGTPLRYARHPQRSAFLNPAFCFGPATFFRTMEEAKAPLFLEACSHRWELYTLHRPVIRLEWGEWDEIPPVDLTGWQECSGANRFQTRFGVRLAEHKLSPMARCGIFSPDLNFERRVPLAVKAHEAFRRLDCRSRELAPLCVSAWLSIPGHRLDEHRMRCFNRLSALRSMELLCYVDSDSAPRVMRNHPYIQEYHPRYGLNIPHDVIMENMKTYVQLSKMFMLAHSRERTLRYSHYIWMDFDYLRYPVYEGTALDWKNVCSDCITMAVVDEQLDTAMIVVPQELLEPLCREIHAVCREELRIGRPLPTEQQLWVRMVTMHPEWFRNYPLPGKHELLGLTMPVRGEEYHTKA